MRACRIDIKNFRGIKSATLLLPRHAVLIGDNNTGKTTVFEALDLVLGPDRLNRQPPVDEHDFFRGAYIAKAPNDLAIAQPASAKAPRIEIEVTVVDLSAEQKAKFGNYAEFWNVKSDTFYEDAKPEGVDAAEITEAMRVTFHGWYDPEEDDFEGKTYFTRSLAEDANPVVFSKKTSNCAGFSIFAR